MNFAYMRVSTGKQNLENQFFEINQFVKTKGLKINDWIEETASGTKKSEDRELGTLLARMKKGDTIIVTELSRLGRSLFDVMSVLNHLMENKVTLYSVKENYELGDNINSKVLAFAFSLSAEIERQLISQRTKEALQKRKSEGKTLGRPKGSKSSSTKLSDHKEKINELAKFGVSHRAIGRMFGVHHSTVTRFLLL